MGAAVRAALRPLRVWSLRLGRLAVLWLLAAWLWPFPDHLLRPDSANLWVLDAAGNPLRRVLARGDADMDWVSLAESGDWAGAAIISAEDKRFRRHPGLDPLALARALRLNLRQGRVASGASTLSTQVIRMVEPRPRTLRTKVLEAFRATQLELRLGKDGILEQYLNRAPFGGNRVGVAAAARAYYGKEARHLSAGEAALLMGLPQSPERFRPDLRPERAVKRRAYVLRRMQEDGVLQAPGLLSEGKQSVAPPFRAPHFTDWVLGTHAGANGEVRSTLDPRMQKLLEDVAHGADAMVDGIALVVMDARTGAVRAMVGGADYDDPATGRVNAALRRRAPGSTLKPFAYALAMQRGWLTPETLLDDRPRAYRDYHPRNMDPRWDGPVSARDALVRSLNLPALQVVDRVGVPRFLGQLRDAGLRLPGVRAEDVGSGSVLGGGMECSLLELVGAYAAFANGGMAQTPHGVPGDAKAGRLVLDPGVAWWISDMLSGPERDVELYGSAADAARPRLAFKTGTSHGPRDAWAIGWNGDWVIGVWRGGMRGGIQPGLSGLRDAAPLLGRIARGLFAEGSEAWPERPAHVIRIDGRDILAGITDPVGEKELPAGFRMVSPAPGMEWRRIGDDPAAIPLVSLGGRGEVHWFHNGVWIGAWPGGERRVLSLGHGQHQIRAVDASGQALRAKVNVF